MLKRSEALAVTSLGEISSKNMKLLTLNDNTILVPQKQLHENAKTTPDSSFSKSEGVFQHQRGFLHLKNHF